jgi:ATP-dependent RNA helicase DDX55/SPB4
MATAGSWKAIQPKLSDTVMKIIHEKFKFETMTPVQAATIPKFLENKDVAVEAPTGSGKTLSFVVPVIERLLKRQEDDGPLKMNEVGALIITPTRELAEQISEVAKIFTEETGFGLLLLIGGTDVTEDVKSYRETGANIVVATPGRLDDFVTRINDIKFKTLEVLILDEADRLLDMGFHMKITTILQRLPKQRRTGLFSATQTKEVSELMKAGLRNPYKITIKVEEKNTNKTQTVPASLTNYYMAVDPDEKIPQLVHFLKQHKDKKIILFCLTCDYVNYIWKILRTIEDLQSIPVLSLHGKIPHNKRTEVYKKFTEVSASVLVSSDVAARGLDMPDIDWIVQLDPPQDPAAFVHRVGRTARMGRQGHSLVFLNHNEITYLELLKLRRVPISEMPKQTGVENVLTKIKNEIIKDREYMEKSVVAFVSYISAYKQHQAHYIFQLRDLDFGKLATGFCLLKMPRMPEIKSVPENFVELPQEKIDAVPYKDKKREKARKVKLAQAKIEEQQKKEERERLKKEKYEQDQINRLRNQEMKKRKLDDLYDDEDDEEEMRREARLLKKLKRGEITEEEFEFAVGEKDMEAEFDGTGENADPENEDGNDEADPDPMEQDPVEDNEEVSNDDGAAQATNKNKKKKKKKKKAKSKPIM